MRRSNAGNPRCLLRGIRRDRRGSILIETAILLPILLTLLAGAIELSRLLLAQQKVSGLSAQTADMVAQAEFGLSESQVNDIFAAISRASKPSESVSTMNPWIPSSVRAQTIAIWASVPLVIHILAPLSTHSSPSRRACVFMLAGSDPPWGSVNPKQPMTSPRAIAGNQVSRCCSDPNA